MQHPVMEHDLHDATPGICQQCVRSMQEAGQQGSQTEGHLHDALGPQALIEQDAAHTRVDSAQGVIQQHNVSP